MANRGDGPERGIRSGQRNRRDGKFFLIQKSPDASLYGNVCANPGMPDRYPITMPNLLSYEN
jgi:hypothetical protein